ncbi:MAG TPA: phosphotransferase [Anaerolineales bacterium]|nr:phosphotransferase [Anaerolineales bacterium]
MSLNAHLRPLDVVLRVHQVFVSSARLRGLLELRASLSRHGLRVPEPWRWNGQSMLRCGARWAELEEFIPHHRLAPTHDSYLWLFDAMGLLHRGLSRVKVAVPQPCVATYAPPSSLRRWLHVTELAVAKSSEARELVATMRRMARLLERHWVPAGDLVVHAIHGDVRLSNVVQTPTRTPVYLDFGFSAIRPRVYDVAYALVFMYWAMRSGETPDEFDWSLVASLLAAYQEAGGTRFTAQERSALLPMMASVPLYAAALDGYTESPIGKLLGRRSFVELSAWLLAHPDVV